MRFSQTVTTVANLVGLALLSVLCGCGPEIEKTPVQTQRFAKPTLATYQRLDRMERSELLEALWRKPDPKNLPFLVEAFGWEPVPLVRYDAARALGRLPSLERDQMVTKLCASGPKCAVDAIDALKRPRTPEARAFFEKAAKAEEWGDRYCLWMYDLGAKDTFAIPLAVRSLANDQDDRVKTAILLFLYRAKTPESLAAIRSFFEGHPGWYEKTGQIGRPAFEEMERELGVRVFAQGETR